MKRGESCANVYPGSEPQHGVRRKETQEHSEGGKGGRWTRTQRHSNNRPPEERIGKLRTRVITVKSRRSTTACNIADVERDLYGEMHKSREKRGEIIEKKERKREINFFNLNLTGEIIQ